MSHTSIQEWLAFALLGAALMATGLLPTLPAAAHSQHVALGIYLIFAGGIGMFITSPTVVELLESIETQLRGLRAE